MIARNPAHNLILMVGALAALWLGGLVFFAAHVERLHEPAIGPGVETTDAIVVLTGGSERVMTGLALLNLGKAKKLFISGVHPGLTLDQVLGSQPVAKELRACCIILDHTAESTLGNAEETRRWMKRENVRSLRLVTANYHMPRSLMIFHAVMPQTEIIPHPVVPDSVRLEDWWAHPGTANLLITEYNKYLGTFLKLWLNKGT
ncbi:MAG: YdcF family protein [Alphaproteobacteria bacterium]|nr:YdcF family protein [Alphaproteobacteria bacterium]